MDSQPQVCVVDDDSSVRKAVGFMLRSSGFSVKTFATGEALLEEVDLTETACILLDLKMPGCSGLEIQEALAEMGSPVPVIFLTGHGDVSSCTQAMKAGAIDFLEKPFAMEDLLASIRRTVT